ncbi:MAG TPA: efflux RND transporter periplasmic adaptor subunit [Bryobacteraceae bacterium]|nr:efflux RND transporter periplasmic adaptor subunit [Bryobacteraceae bacterium]
MFAVNGMVAVGLACLLVIGCNASRSRETGAQPPPPVVTVAEVQSRTVPLYRELVGRTDANRTVNIRPQASGILEQALFAEGQPVAANAVLFRIDPSQYEAALQSAQAQLTKAEADVVQAEAQLGKVRQDVARYQPLAQQRAIPQEDYENALAAAKVAEAQVQQAKSSVTAAQAAVSQAKLNLGYTVIRSPISGIIGRREVDPGNLVDPQTLLAIISSANPIRVHYDVSDVDYLRFAERRRRPGAKLSFELLLPDGTRYPYEGRLFMVGRAVTSATGTLPVVAEFPNPNNLLRPGQFVRVRVTTGQIPNAILIPQIAVQELLGTTSVMLVTPDNKVVQRTITTEGTHDNFTVVSKGLQGGERVIVEGQQKVRAGMTVKPQSAKQAN